MNLKIRETRIALVDDHILLRDALAKVIDGFDNCRVVMTASNGKDFLDKLKVVAQPNLAILDINMPEMDGFETAQFLRLHHPDIRVLTLTMYDSELAMIRLLQMGVRGFLKKDIHPGELQGAINSTMRDGYYYSGTTSIKLANLLRTGVANTPIINTVSVTENELQFLELASTEMTYKEIALKMKVSHRTVDNYRDALFTKLSVKSRVGLVMYAVANGIVKIEY